jgi:hypothetical protein
MQLMDRHNVKYIAVYDRFNFKGVISSHDLMKQVLNKRKKVFEDDVKTSNYSWDY